MGNVIKDYIYTQPEIHYDSHVYLQEYKAINDNCHVQDKEQVKLKKDLWSWSTLFSRPDKKKSFSYVGQGYSAVKPVLVQT